MIVALCFAPLPALMAEFFPWRTRTRGLSLSYSLGVTIFSGFAPFIATRHQGVRRAIPARPATTPTS